MSETEYAQSTRPSSVAPSPPPETDVASDVEDVKEVGEKVCELHLWSPKVLINV